MLQIDSTMPPTHVWEWGDGSVLLTRCSVRAGFMAVNGAPSRTRTDEVHHARKVVTWSAGTAD